MLYLKKISLYELPDLIYNSYKGDTELLEKYHIAHLSLDEAVAATFSMIKNASYLHHLDCYKVIHEKQPIGYVVTYEGDNLYSYAINKSFRKKDILIEWWDKVKKSLNKNFMTMLYDNNTRAASFLEKQGLKIFNHDKETKVITFINN